MQGSLMPDRLNQVVSSEPSLGTPHAMGTVYAPYSAASIAAGTVTVTVSNIPTGTKAVWVWFDALYSAEGTVSIQTVGGVSFLSASEKINQYGNGGCLIPIDSNKQFKLVNNTALTSLNMKVTGYWI